MKNVILIGMPGSGKSTLGVLLAKKLAKRFVDTDIEIQQFTGEPLQQTLETQGYKALRDIEAQVLSNLNFENSVVATGGSAVYSKEAMNHLRQQNGWVVFLNVGVEQLEARIKDFSTRGIAGAPGQSIRDLYSERYPLYQEFADQIVDFNDQNVEASVLELSDRLAINGAN